MGVSISGQLDGTGYIIMLYMYIILISNNI